MKTHFNFSAWVEYFISNRNNLRIISWTDDYKLTRHEFTCIFNSIRIFQKGESSEARHLFQKANEFLNKQHDKSYFEALTLFIHEEHRHSFELKRFMLLQDIPCLASHWSDSAFRKLRKFGGLEQSVTVLLTAEMVAAVYYKALQKSTNSKVLHQICEQILSDEEMHIQFQSESLSQFYVRRSSFVNFMVFILRRLLLEGTLIAVWKDHKNVFTSGGYNFFSFRKNAMQEFKKTCEIIKAKQFQFSTSYIKLKTVLINQLTNN